MKSLTAEGKEIQRSWAFIKCFIIQGKNRNPFKSVWIL